MRTKERCVRRWLQHRSSAFLVDDDTNRDSHEDGNLAQRLGGCGQAKRSPRQKQRGAQLRPGAVVGRCLRQWIHFNRQHDPSHPLAFLGERWALAQRYGSHRQSNYWQNHASRPTGLRPTLAVGSGSSLNSAIVARGSRCFRGAKADNRGFTLMELLLVLAILVVIGAIVTPAIFGPLQNQRLHNSADLIRAEWSEARVNAMRTGLIHVFQYQPDTGNYLIKPWMAEGDFLEGNPLETPLGNTPGESAYQAYSSWEQLPERVVFIQGTSESDLRWQMHLAEEGADNLTDSSLSPPIVFYPDGTTSNAQIWLSLEEKKYFISVQMRGMTGLSRIGPLMSAEEMQ